MTETVLKLLLKEFEVKLVIQFGNKAESAKDIDVIIVSDNFVGISDKKRRDLICKINESLDPVCFTSTEYNNLRNSDSPFLNAITNTSKVIYGHF